MIIMELVLGDGGLNYNTLIKPSPNSIGFGYLTC